MQVAGAPIVHLIFLGYHRNMGLKGLFTARFTVPMFHISTFFVPSQTVFAHCETLDGPVVSAARRAIEKDNANYILIWVEAENEHEIRQVFEKTMDARRSANSDEERNRIELELFENLVRVHREGEGAKYEGLKPAGSIEPELALADKAVETGKLDDVLGRIESSENAKIILHLFHKVEEKSHYDIDDVPAGREFVASYVVFIHAVEKAIKGLALDEAELHHH